MVEVRSTSVERLTSDLKDTPPEIEEDVARGRDSDEDDLAVERILARARENVYQSRRLHQLGLRCTCNHGYVLVVAPLSSAIVVRQHPVIAIYSCCSEASYCCSLQTSL